MTTELRATPARLANTSSLVRPSKLVYYLLNPPETPTKSPGHTDRDTRNRQILGGATLSHLGAVSIDIINQHEHHLPYRIENLRLTRNTPENKTDLLGVLDL